MENLNTMEGGESTESTHNTKVSDSAYSNSCSNSQSQRSGSSKSRLSGSHSSGSSGYGGKPSTQASSSDMIIKRNKDKSRKKKKNKGAGGQTQLQTQISASASLDEEEKPRPSGGGGSGCVDQQILLQDQQHGEDHRNEPEVTEHGVRQRDRKREREEEDQTESDFPIPSPLTVNIVPPSMGGGVGGCGGVGHASGLDSGLGKFEKTWESAPGKLESMAGVGVAGVGGGAAGVQRGERVKEESFCCVISMHDGIVLYTTPSITDVLGFPRDMWLGRSFIDFVHIKDRATFASQITTGIPIAESRGSMPKDAKSTFCVMLRRYRGLKSGGFGVIGRPVSYEPFRLGLTFREAPEEARPDNYMVSNGTNMLLVICATPIKSSYKVPDEILSQKSPKFAIRHTATGIISHVDSAAVSALGYLPQDLIGRSIMDFYHHEDLTVIKETYETVMKKGQTAGASFCSKPYRFLIQNGCYVLLETEWTSFVNPWSRKLEFVVGHHRVFQGPKQCNVFEAAPTCKNKISEEAQNRNTRIKEDIVKLLAETVSRPSDTVKQEVSRRCQALASFMETLMDEVSRADLKLELPHENELTVSERDSVMLGEISPHHDYYDSKSSTETPPSYNQLNYNENLLRFFNSKPVTAPAELDPPKTEPPEPRGTCVSGTSGPMSPVHEGSGGSGSSGNFTTASNIHMSSVTNTSIAGTGGTGTATGTGTGTGAGTATGTGTGTATGTGTGTDTGIGKGTGTGTGTETETGTGTGNETNSATGTNSSKNGGGGGGATAPPITLTESLLNKHNDEMEKFMLKKHRESRGRTGEKSKKSANDTLKMLEYSGPGHGIKRGGSHSWEGEANKPKQQVTLGADAVKAGAGGGAACSGGAGSGGAGVAGGGGGILTSEVRTTTAVSGAGIPGGGGGGAAAAAGPTSSVGSSTPGPSSYPSCTQNINLWPPFSVGITPPVHSTHTAMAPSSFSTAAGLFPTFYYIPASLTPTSPTRGSPRIHKHPHKSGVGVGVGVELPTTSQQAAAAAAQAMPLQYMAGVMYPHPSLFYTHPAAAAATAMMYQPMPFPGMANALQMPEQPMGSQSAYNKTVYTAAPASITKKVPGAFHSVTIPASVERPSSLATSAKAEPGSNGAGPDSCKKEVTDSSPIPSVMNDYNSDPPCSSNAPNNKKYTDSNGNSDDMDGSSFSSFYSSFIKTTDGSESPPDTEKDPRHRKLKSISVSESKIMEHPEEEDQTQHGDG
ncbi:hypothetical protein M5D96_013288 [Drosophila gunungcola]|uniref:Period circadian protein n=1 Tax=Drosophila gunungcola TaxID=103775 RepID=A0A9P9YBL9_9MUSC|nr:hypothetical protein M5D96_013288 [Drosophila gunungcola]